MDDSLLLQKQIKNNAEEVQSYLADMRQWLKDMKRKQDLNYDYSSDKQPPLADQESGKRVKKNTHNKGGKKESEKPKRISSYDYAKWDNFDVEKACEDIDRDDIPEANVIEDEEESQKLRDQALYEKELGNEQVKKQNWKEAIQYYNRAIKCYAYDPVFYANRALCFLKTKDLKSAETDCTAAIQLDPTYVKAYVRRATARTELRQYKDAKEDLEKALELEPNNTVAKNDLAKIEKKLLSPSSKKTKKEIGLPPSSSTASKPEKKTDLLSTSSSGAIKSGKAKEPQKVIAKDQKGVINEEVLGKGRGDAEESVISSKGPWKTGDVRLVQTIHKPPHLRSKKPLKRINIQDVCDDDIVDITNKSKSCGDAPTVPPERKMVNDLPSQKIADSRNAEDLKTGEVIKDQKQQFGDSTDDKPLKEQTVNSQAHDTDADVSQQVPPVPKSSVQFLLSWKIVKSNKKLRFMFLKQIPGRELARIFDNSLESDTVSDLVSVLSTDFLENKEPVYPFLLGLCSVQRFKALVMFLTKADKAGIKKLLDYCVTSGECSKEEADRVAKEYEVM
ncbi:RNA polymerase II-associated protein 3 [Anabrus simplex]|uniref:RNA polymerase II-associated protein 3 n=1 Tax=Anabrus simplex TaxID=316456 RepID=UPI0035A28F2D